MWSSAGDNALKGYLTRSVTRSFTALEASASASSATERLCRGNAQHLSPGAGRALGQCESRPPPSAHVSIVPAGPGCYARSRVRMPHPAIGRYEIYGELASGGMAEILLGRVVGPNSFERPVVVKRILRHL